MTEPVPADSAELIDAWVANMAARVLTVATQQLRRGALTAYARSIAPLALTKGTTPALTARLERHDNHDTRRAYLLSAHQFYRWAVRASWSRSRRQPW